MKKNGLARSGQFGNIKRLLPFVFATLNTRKIEAPRRDEESIDLGSKWSGITLDCKDSTMTLATCLMTLV